MLNRPTWTARDRPRSVGGFLVAWVSSVAADVAKVKALGLPHKDTTDDDLPMASRLYLAMKSFLDNENLDALTIREWPEMPNTFGQWPYLGVARSALGRRWIERQTDVSQVNAIAQRLKVSEVIARLLNARGIEPAMLYSRHKEGLPAPVEAKSGARKPPLTPSAASSQSQRKNAPSGRWIRSGRSRQASRSCATASRERLA